MNQSEILAALREAFQQLETAISSNQPERCRAYVSEQLYEAVVAMVTDLAARGRRRVHGSFEILDSTLVDVQSSDHVQARIHAISSIAEVDGRGRVVQGSTARMTWRQDVTGTRRVVLVSQSSWMISELGAMSVVGEVTGPAGQPMDPARVRALELERLERERDAAIRFAARHRVNVMTYLSGGSGTA